MINIIYSDKEKEESRDYFNFRIIVLPDGIEVVDHTLKTPYSALTAVQMVEYVQMDTQIAVAERMKRRERREEEHRQRLARNPLYRLAYFCGLA